MAIATQIHAGAPDSASALFASGRPLRVLVCDDQSDVRYAMTLLLRSRGHVADAVGTPVALLERASDGYDLLIVDLNYARDTTSGEEGLDLLAELARRGNQAPVVVMTAWSSVGLAVQAMQRGASDFIEKPWDNARALEVIEEVIEKQAQSKASAASELDAAVDVQRRLLPASGMRLATLDYAGRCDAAFGVAGDGYDFLDAGDGRVGFLLSDVSGKGMPAALLMANLQACFRSRGREELAQPLPLLTAINRHLHASTGAERFATLFYGVYDEASRRLRYVNCGHCPPVLLRASGEVIRLDPSAMMLGAFAQWDGQECEISIAPGDCLLIYSDGVTEAENEVGADFGEQRLVDLLRQGATADSLAERVTAAVRQFSGAKRSDDVTVLVMRGVDPAA